MSRRTTVPWDKATAAEVADWLGTLKAPRVAAVPAIKVGADDDAWLAARDAGLGASDIGVVMGLSKFSSPYALWWQKHLHLRVPATEQMSDGHLLEPHVAQEFARRHPEMLVTVPSPRLWAHRDYPWALCTPDRLGVQLGEPMILDGAWPEEDARAARELRLEDNPSMGTATPQVVPIEVKYDASPGWGPSGSLQYPQQYALQVMWQAWILGAPGGWLVNHKPAGRNRYREYWIPVDPALIDHARYLGQSFVASLEMGISPEPDGSPATEEVLRTINADFSPDEVADVPPLLVERWTQARELRRQAIERAREMDNRMREAMGRAGQAIDAATGAVVARRNSYKRGGYEVGPAVIDELRMVKDDGHRGEGHRLPEADGPEGPNTGAVAQGEEEVGRRDAAAEQGVGGEASRAAGAVTGAGSDLTPERLEELAQEAEAGYDVRRLTPRHVVASGAIELADQGGTIPASPELIGLGEALLWEEARASVALDHAEGAQTFSVDDGGRGDG